MSPLSQQLSREVHVCLQTRSGYCQCLRQLYFQILRGDSSGFLIRGRLEEGHLGQNGRKLSENYKSTFLEQNSGRHRGGHVSILGSGGMPPVPPLGKPLSLFAFLQLLIEGSRQWSSKFQSNYLHWNILHLGYFLLRENSVYMLLISSERLGIF